MPETQLSQRSRPAPNVLEALQEFYDFIDEYILGMIPGTRLEKPGWPHVAKNCK